MKKQKIIMVVIGVTVSFLVSITSITYAASTPNLTQTINQGTLSTDILDSSRNSVSNPSAAMATANFSFDCQTVTGTLGSSSQRVYVIDGLDDGHGWTLSIAATGGAGATWQNTGNTKSYAYNDNTGSGCTNGQLTIDPSVSTVTTDCSSSACTSSTITKGSSTAMTSSTAVTLMTGSSNASLYRGYMTGISLSQKIPAEQSPDSYSLGMTITVVAN